MHEQAQLRLKKDEVEKLGAAAYVVLAMDRYRAKVFKEENLLLSRFRRPVFQGDESRLRHGSLGPGEPRIGVVWRVPEVRAVGELGGKPSDMVCHRSPRNSQLRRAAHVCDPDVLRGRHRPGAGGTEKGGTLKRQRNMNFGGGCHALGSA